jgi:TolB-like protein
VIRRFVWSLILLLAWWPVAAAAQQPTVAVLDFNAFSLSLEDASAVGKGIAGMIMTELSNRPQVRVVERQQRDSLVAAQKIALSGRATDQQALQVGQLLGAQYIILGNVALEKETARLDIRILEVETGAIYQSMKRTGKRDEFLSVVETLANDFTKDLKLPERKVLAQVEIPVDASLAFSRGLDYEKRGKLTDAVQMFKRAVELFPTHREAQSALERVNSKGGKS